MGQPMIFSIRVRLTKLGEFLFRVRPHESKHSNFMSDRQVINSVFDLGRLEYSGLSRSGRIKKESIDKHQKRGHSDGRAG